MADNACRQHVRRRRESESGCKPQERAASGDRTFETIRTAFQETNKLKPRHEQNWNDKTIVWEDDTGARRRTPPVCRERTAGSKHAARMQLVPHRVSTHSDKRGGKGQKSTQTNEELSSGGEIGASPAQTSNQCEGRTRGACVGTHTPQNDGIKRHQCMTLFT